MDTDPTIHRDLGALNARMSRMETDFAAMNAKVDKIHDVVTAAGGSWRTLVALAAFAAALGGLLVAALAWLWPR